MSKSPKRPQTKRFDRAPQASISRSSFDLSHPYKTTFDGGWLYPFLVQEVLPADSFKVRTTAFVRLATPIHPTMDNLHIETFYFFVANRLLWDNWQKFMGEQDNPGDSTDYLIPSVAVTATPVASGEIWDYFGLPLGAIFTAENPISLLPARAYSKIWDEWFRDENLQNSENNSTGDGPESPANYRLRRRGKRKNYISSCLPWPQKGPGVDLPLGTTAPIQGIGVIQGQTLPVTNTAVTETGGGAATYVNAAISANIANFMAFEGENSGGDPAIYADLSNATASTINDLRQAFQIQKLQERDARGGTRYTEIIKSHFQTVSPDARLQRPEYLGGGYSAVQMNTVPQTSETAAATPQGNLSAYGTASVHNHGFTKSFVEHGYIIGLFSVRADQNYQQRIDRHWTRQTKYDFYWPALQALGEQPVYNREVYTDGTATDAEVWGYQERWSEYRQEMGKITGLFRSDATGTLDPWHYALDFASRPSLNASFIEENPPIARTIAVQDEPEFLIDAWHSIKAARPMPIYSVPGYIDHF